MIIFIIVLQLKGSEFIEISQRLSILLAIESQIFISLQVLSNCLPYRLVYKC